MPNKATITATYDDGHAALRQAQAMTLMLQSYLASDHAQACPIAEKASSTTTACASLIASRLGSPRCSARSPIMDGTAGTALDRRSPGAEIVEDLVAAIAGAACLIGTGAPADVVCAQTLLMQARERCATFAEIVRNG